MFHVNERTLDELLAGEVSGPRLARIRRHAEGCRACARRLEEWRDNFDEIEALLPPLVDPPIVGMPDGLNPMVLVPAPRPQPFRLEPTTVLWTLGVIAALGVGYFASRLGKRDGWSGLTPGSNEAVAAPTILRDSPLVRPIADPPADSPTGALGARGTQLPAAGLGSGLDTHLDTTITSRDAAAPSRDTARDLAARAAPPPVRQPAATPAPPAPDDRGVPARDESIPVPPENQPAERDDGSAPPEPDPEPQDDVPAGIHFRRVSMAEAGRRLGGGVRVLEGLTPERIELAAGRAVPGAQPNADIVRLTYRNVDGTRILLDQQRILPDESGFRPINDARLESGDTAYGTAPNGVSVATWIDPRSYRLSLVVRAGQDSLRRLIARIR